MEVKFTSDSDSLIGRVRRRGPKADRANDASTVCHSAVTGPLSAIVRAIGPLLWAK
jgi:hypothetical protein